MSDNAKVEQLESKMSAIERSLEKVKKHFDRNQDGVIDKSDDKLILRDALKFSQNNYSETIDTMQKNYNEQQEKLSKRAMWEKISMGLILIAGFLSSVFQANIF